MSNPKLVFRQSDLKTWKRCGRKTWLSVFRNLERSGTRGPNKADVGTACHAGLAAYYTEQDPFGAIDAQWTKWQEELEVVATDEWMDVLNLSKIMVEGYVDWVESTGQDAGITFDRVEERIEKFVGTFYGYDVFISGAIDLTGTDDLGIRRLYDTKTVDRFEDDPVFQINDQLQTYDWLADHKFELAVHNRLRRVKRTARSKPPYYERIEIHFTAVQRANFELQLKGTVDAMVRAIVDMENGKTHFEVVPPNPTRDCSWDCPFVSICPMFNLGDDVEGLIQFAYKEKKPYAEAE